VGYLTFNELALNKVVAENSYHKFDLSEAGKLSALILKVGEKCTTDHLVTEKRIPDHITKLEVIGKRDKTIRSIRGLDNQAIHAYRTGVMPPRRDLAGTNQYCYEEFMIMFGRYIGDPLLYLDLGKDPDIDLKITNDFDVTTYWTNDELKYTLHEVLLPNNTPPEKGYIRSYEHSYWAAVSGETANKKLTPGEKVFDVMLRGAVDYTATSNAPVTSPWNILREISVDFLNKKEKIIDSMETRDLMFILGQMYGGPWRTGRQFYIGASERYPETFIGYRTHKSVTQHIPTADTQWIGAFNDDAGPMKVYKDSAGLAHLWAEGYLPFNSIKIPFDIGWPGVPLLDTEAKKPVYIRVKANNSNGDVYMVVEELGSL